MRSDQFIGLRNTTQLKLKSRATQDTVITENPDGEIIDKKQVIHQDTGRYRWHGMVDNYTLPAYVFKDGTRVYEKVQETVWSSGPVIFTYLVDEAGNEALSSKWTKEEMYHYL